MSAEEIELDWNANVEADIAYLEAQKAGATQAECVQCAIRAYLAAAALAVPEDPQ